jgi:hypothetical protein
MHSSHAQTASGGAGHHDTRDHAHPNFISPTTKPLPDSTAHTDYDTADDLLEKGTSERDAIQMWEAVTVGASTPGRSSMTIDRRNNNKDNDNDNNNNKDNNNNNNKDNNNKDNNNRSRSSNHHNYEDLVKISSGQNQGVVETRGSNKDTRGSSRGNSGIDSVSRSDPRRDVEGTRDGTCNRETDDGYNRDAGAQAQTQAQAQAQAQESAVFRDESEAGLLEATSLDLIFDPQSGCYYHPRTNQWFAAANVAP